jgi:hypothetical protein
VGSSSGQLERILTEDKDAWHDEKDALSYFREHSLSQPPLTALQSAADRVFTERPQWEAYLRTLDICNERHRRVATEGALLGGLDDKGLAEGLAIVSDDAGPFDGLTHGLCWVHAERLIHKLIPLNEAHRADPQAMRAEIGAF